MLRKIGIDDIIQIKSAYSWSPAEKDELKWSTIPRSTAVKLYQKYFADFVIFGYSTDEVIPFINASDSKLGKIFSTFGEYWAFYCDRFILISFTARFC